MIKKRTAVKIDAYQFGEMVVRGVTYHNDLIVFENRILDSWWRTKGHEVHVEDLEEVLKQQGTEVLVVGKGEPGYMDIKPETQKALESRGIKVLALPTKQAWKKYNALRETHNAVGAFHLTC
jgi:hypothetical protein